MPLLSVCIPTLNRPAYLLEALRSIFESTGDRSGIELCISNNCSNTDYREVEDLIAANSCPIMVKYIKQVARIPVDAHMHFVKNMAAGDYIFFLGDDDFFLKDQLALLKQYIQRVKPDLAIFNGHVVDENGACRGNHFLLPPAMYTDLASAFRVLRDKGMFGAVLARRELLLDEDFSRLYGTSHAYGCFWFGLMRRASDNQPLLIAIPDFPCVALRQAAKNYDHLLVYFRDIPYESAVYKRFAPPAGLPLVAEFDRNQWRKVSSVRFLVGLAALGCDLRRIASIDRNFYTEHKVRIMIARWLGCGPIYRGMRSVYRGWRERRNPASA